jgi:hypothetical protein
MTARPELPKLKRGDLLHATENRYGRKAARDWRPVKVVSVGPKYVHVIAAERFTDDVSARDWNVRKFLLDDQHEGARSERTGHAASLATDEQRAYDERLAAADEYLREQGIVIDRWGKWYDPDRRVRLAELVLGAELGGPQGC